VSFCPVNPKRIHGKHPAPIQGKTRRILNLDFIFLFYTTLMRVLIVEDERKISAYVKRGLEESGYAVDAAYTGQEALDWAEAAPYDVIILDILLPAKDGLAVCRELRQRGDRTPVLMLTARDTVDDRVAGLDAGADDYLVKPFAMKELLARLRALTRRASDQPKSAVIEFADLALDTRTHQVHRSGRRIELAAKEYAVLECLMREPERVLTRTQIVEHVWNYDTYNQSNVVDVYIRNLRRKIDDPFEQKLIHTIRGAGYRLSIHEMD
jgi:heavy metal response regulator